MKCLLQISADWEGHILKRFSSAIQSRHGKISPNDKFRHFSPFISGLNLTKIRHNRRKNLQSFAKPQIGQTRVRRSAGLKSCEL